MAFGCLVYSVSSSLALALSRGMCASMCPCFHHFLLFSAKKWDCTSGDFYSFSHFVIHDGILPGLSRARRKRHRRHGGFGKASRNLAACKRVHGLPCLRIAKLCYFSGSPATAEQGEGYRRFVCKLQKALHPFEKWLLFIARLQTLSQKRQNLHSAKPEDVVLPLSFPKIHILHCLT